MDIISKRLLETIKDRDVTYRDLAKKTGFSPSAICKYANGNIAKLDIKRIKALADALDTLPAYLMGWSDEKEINPPAKYIQVPKISINQAACWENYANNNKVDELYSFRSDWLCAKGNPESIVLMEAEGDFMEPLIFAGDIVMVNRDKKDLTPNAIYAVRMENLIYLKCIDREPGKFILRCRNKFYESIRLDTHDFNNNNLDILGRVVWWCHDELPQKVF